VARQGAPSPRSIHDKHYPTPIVFEGNAPADIRENDLLRAALDSRTRHPAGHRALLARRAQLDQGPDRSRLPAAERQHMLIVGQREEASLTMLGLSMLALAAQYPGRREIRLLAQAVPGSPKPISSSKSSRPSRMKSSSRTARIFPPRSTISPRN
jgi:hypothetical protein